VENSQYGLEVINEKKRIYVKIALSSIRIYSSAQTALTWLNRLMRMGESEKKREKEVYSSYINEVLNDFRASIEMFQSLTNIKLPSVEEDLCRVEEALEKEDYGLVYDEVQRILRDGWLGNLMKLAEQS